MREPVMRHVGNSPSLVFQVIYLDNIVYMYVYAKMGYAMGGSVNNASFDCHE